MLCGGSGGGGGDGNVVSVLFHFLYGACTYGYAYHETASSVTPPSLDFRSALATRPVTTLLEIVVGHNIPRMVNTMGQTPHVVSRVVVCYGLVALHKFPIG